MSKTHPLYPAWQSMKGRCLNMQAKDYPHYGGRGIKVCEQWISDFDAFAVDMGPKPSPAHTLDRIDNDGDYEPGNCRWATRKEQAHNRRNSLFVVVGDRRMVVAEAARLAGVSAQMVTDNLRAGEPIEQAVKLKIRRATKLDAAAQAAVRACREVGMSQALVAAEFGVSQSYIWKISHNA